MTAVTTESAEAAIAPTRRDERDWRTPTSRLQRFTEAVTILCAGHVPPADMVKAWLEPDSDDLRLQHFCATHGPSWAQGIVCLDAAACLADSPVEGVDDV